MKKMRVIGLCAASAVLAFSLVGCSGGDTQQPSEEQPVSEDNSTVTGKVSDNTETEVEDANKPQQINVGEMFTIPDMFEVTLQSAEWSDQINPSDTSSHYVYMTPDEGQSFLVIRGTLKNIGAETMELGYGSIQNLAAAFKINDKYSLDGAVSVDNGTGFRTEIDPLVERGLVIYTQASNEIRESFESCEVTLTAMVKDENNVWNNLNPVGIYTATFQ